MHLTRIRASLPKASSTMPQKVAVVIVDMQTARAWNQAPMKHWERKDRKTVENICRVLEAARLGGIPIALIKHAPPTGKRIPIDTEIMRAAGNAEPLEKDQWDAVKSSDLHHFLRSNGVKTVFIGGYHPSRCVYRTSQSLKGLGYGLVTSPAILVGDATSLETKDDFASAFFYLFRTKLFLKLDRLIEHMKKIAAVQP